MVNKKALTEEDIKLQFITPAINRAGWENHLIKMEYSFTAGRVIFVGDVHDRKAKKRADYVLLDRNDYPLAIVEAKDNNKPIGGGMQQAVEYAEMLDIKFAYSSNGDAFLEHDFLTGKEREIALTDFPTPNELRNRLNEVVKLTPSQQSIVEMYLIIQMLIHTSLDTTKELQSTEQ
jgi:type I restriction enzyme R subunit